MKNSSSLVPHTSFLLVTLFLLLTLGKGLRFTHHHYTSSSFHGKGTHNGHQSHVNPQEGEKEEGDMRVYPTGSSLPDYCSHACGPCFPCKRVMVSFKCSVAESCPIVYRCTCKGKYYHVPSN
ncbi:unnamed protein product, partial [Vitis vinifera]|uniref:Epidermal patterning factor-like protein n=1 Tax=Vitis vinifera TaxID=29760 RepID=D7TXU6_VITVI